MTALGINLLLWGDYRQWKPELLFPALADIGYTHLELPLFEFNPQRDRAWRTVADDLGLSLSLSSALPTGASLVTDTHAAEAALDFHRRLVETAMRLNATLVIGPLYHPVGEMILPCDQSALQSQLTDALAKLIAPLYTGTGVRMALEPLNRFETNVVNTVRDAAAICASINASWLGMMADTFHAHIEESSQTAALNDAGPHLIHLHASESHRGVPGTGQVDWTAWSQGVKARALTPVVECFGQSVPELAAATRVWRDLTGDPLQCAREAYSFLTRIIQPNP